MNDSATTLRCNKLLKYKKSKKNVYYRQEKKEKVSKILNHICEKKNSNSQMQIISAKLYFSKNKHRSMLSNQLSFAKKFNAFYQKINNLFLTLLISITL